MNITLVKALIVLIPAVLLAARSAFIVRRGQAVVGLLQLCGAMSLMVVALTHIAEAVHLFPVMRWGEAHSAGHYLDLSSALLAMTLLAVGCLLDVARRKRAH